MFSKSLMLSVPQEINSVCYSNFNSNIDFSFFIILSQLVSELDTSYSNKERADEWEEGNIYTQPWLYLTPLTVSSDPF